MAKQSILDIIIRTIKQGGGDKEVVKGLTAVKGAITSGLGAFAALAGAAYAVDKALDATVDVYVNYAQHVRDAKLALGLSADETSRVIALTDDLGISYEDLSATIKKNADNTQFSIEGLAAASEEYLKLGDAQERAKFAQEKYGKQWQEFAKLLEKGPAQVKAMAAAVDEGHLFDEADLKRVEVYRIGLDKLHDNFESIQMSVGERVVPMLNNMMNSVERMTTMTKQQSTALVYLDDALADGRITTDEYNDALTRLKLPIDESTTAMDESAKAADALGVNYDKLLGSIKGMQSETDRYKDTQDEANAAIKQANLDFAAGDIKLDERNKILDENQKKLDANAEAHKRWAAETVFAFAQAKAAADGNITEGEGQILIDMGVQLGLFDEKTATVMENVNSAFDNVDTENAQAVIDALKQQLELLTGEPWTITINANTSGVSNPVSGSCFIAGTTIAMADGSLKEIEDVIAGDEVISYDLDQNTLITARVEGTYAHTGDEMGEAYLLINGRIGVTPNHLLYVNGEWAAAGTLKHGDWLRTQDDYEMIETVTWIDRRVPTYNLHIGHESHNYFADGILAHNKARGGIAHGPGDGTTDTFWAPLANGEGIINARAMAEPGMAELLHALNNGSLRGANNSRSVVIQNLTVVAQGRVMDVLEELG